MKRAFVFLTVLSLCLTACAWADPLPRFGEFPALGACTGNDVRLRDKPGTGKESRVVGKVNEFDQLIVLGQTALNGQTWYEVEHPRAKGTVWIFGDYVQPVFDREEQDSLRARVILSLNLAFGVTPEKARVLLGKPREDKTERFNAGGERIVLRDLAWAGRTAGYLSGHLVHAGATKGALPFEGVHIGAPASRLADALGEPTSRSDGSWEYRLDDMTFLTFELKDGRVSGMSYQVYYDIGG